MVHRVHSGDADAHGPAEWLVSFDATPLYTNYLPQGMKGIGADKAALYASAAHLGQTAPPPAS